VKTNTFSDRYKLKEFVASRNCFARNVKGEFFTGRKKCIAQQLDLHKHRESIIERINEGKHLFLIDLMRVFSK
jgi:hypothetical protein